MPELPAHHAVVASGEETLNIYGYRTSKARTFLFWALSILTLGIFRLLMHWSEKLYMKVRAAPCSLDQADLILVIDDNNVLTIRPVVETKAMEGEHLVLPNEKGDEMTRVDRFKWFTFRKMKYVWFESECKYITNADIDSTVKVSVLQKPDDDPGLNSAEVASRVLTYGSNLIAVNLKPILVLLFKEAITPFYIFQIFRHPMWFTDGYDYYAAVIVILSLLSLGTDVFQMRQQEKKLRAMIHSVDQVEVLRDGEVKTISSEELVVGDTLIIPRNGCTLQCDAVLLNGTVIVNESMLTGESVPITKMLCISGTKQHTTSPRQVALTGIDEDNSGGQVRFNFDKHSKHVLFCGTSILQTRFYGGQHVKAVVVRTAFSTLKGQLVRSIMYPKPVDFRFTRDLFRFVLFLGSIAGCGMIYTLVIMILRGNAVKDVIIRSLDVITVAVPPALPAAMSVGIINSKMRLGKKQIFCISPSTINTCGAINVCCFDKTGTLTEDGLDFLTMLGVRPASPLNRQQFTQELDKMDPAGLPLNGELVKAIATCHSLTRIEGKLNGDPLDLILFNQTGWTIEEGNELSADQSQAESGLFDAVQPTILRPPVSHTYDNNEYTILRQFTFSSSLQRMSVIVGAPDDEEQQLILYSKGSPEMIQSLCKPETVPADYNDIVNSFAQHGYRLIAVARKTIDMGYAKAAKIARGMVENDLEMLGLVIMENRVKPQTLGVINLLTQARIRTVMVTGDNILTGLSVARECGIIRPDKKTFILEHKKDEKNIEGRTRLTIKQSVSSSEDIIDEASFLTDVETKRRIDSSYHLAVSGPTFAVITHEYPELLHKLVCVCDVFARMAPDQKKQLVNTLQAAHAGVSLSEAEASIAAPFTSKIADISCVPEVIREGRAALVTSFGIFKYMAAYSLTDKGLSSTPPPTRLFSVASIASILGVLCIVAASQISVFVLTTYMDWFVPYVLNLDDEADKMSMQGTAIFGVSIFQYIGLAIMFSKGAPYRKTIFYNKIFLALLVFQTGVNIWVVLFPPSFIATFLDYDPIPTFGYRLFFVLVSIFSIALMFIFETFIVDALLHNKREIARQDGLLKKSSSFVSYPNMIEAARYYSETQDNTSIYKQVKGVLSWLRQKKMRSEEGAGQKFERTLVAIGSEPIWIRAVARYLPADPMASKSSSGVKTEEIYRVKNVFRHFLYGGQNFTVKVDTAQTDIWVIDIICKTPACRGYAESGYMTQFDMACTIVVTGSLVQRNTGPYFISGTCDGRASTDVMNLGGIVSEVNQGFGLAQEVIDIFEQLPIDGVLGLAWPAQGEVLVNLLLRNNLDKLDASLFTIWLDRRAEPKEAKLGGLISYGALDNEHCDSQADYVILSSSQTY
uniref:Cation-transporting ATPase n=1 Tax=Pristionchus pacificus TaxID=54126 RepID=A0A2A6C396_PRIPA|eukprot:PDM72577.1 hydrolase [Pristionchus pacificus]